MPSSEVATKLVIMGPRRVTERVRQKRCTVPSRLQSTKSATSAGCGKLAPALAPRSRWIPEFPLQIAAKMRADERTRTADLISSRVKPRARTGLPVGCRYGGFAPGADTLHSDQDIIFVTETGGLLEASNINQWSFKAWVFQVGLRYTAPY